MMRFILFAVALVVAGASPATAQTTAPGGGPIGSTTLRNGYPAGGGAVSLPSGTAAATSTTTPAPAGAATSAATATGGSGSGSGGSGPSGGASSAGGAAGGRSGAARVGGTARSSGGTHWVLCPPDGASGMAALFTGTDLSCAP
jgi:hypothetical protein